MYLSFLLMLFCHRTSPSNTSFPDSWTFWMCPTEASWIDVMSNKVEPVLFWTLEDSFILLQTLSERWLDDQTWRVTSSDGQMGEKLSKFLDGWVSSWKVKFNVPLASCFWPGEEAKGSRFDERLLWLSNNPMWNHTVHPYTHMVIHLHHHLFFGNSWFSLSKTNGVDKKCAVAAGDCISGGVHTWAFFKAPSIELPLPFLSCVPCLGNVSPCL